MLRNLREQVDSACSSEELTDTTSGSNALLSTLREKLGANDHGRCGELSLSENLEEALYGRTIVY